MKEVTINPAVPNQAAEVANSQESIYWKQISLIDLKESHLPLLFEWRNSNSFLQYLTARKKLSDLAEFKLELDKDFATDRHLQFLISYRNKPIGTIFSYSLNKIDKYCFISVFTDLGFISKGISPLAFLMFCNYLFSNFNLYKIYFDVYEYNATVISLLKKRNIKIEGQFKKQHLVNSTRYDVFRFAVYSEDIQHWQLANNVKF